MNFSFANLSCFQKTIIFFCQFISDYYTSGTWMRLFNLDHNWSNYNFQHSSLNTLHRLILLTKLLCILYINLNKILLYTWRTPLKLNFRKPYKNNQRVASLTCFWKCVVLLNLIKRIGKKKLFFCFEECVALTSWKNQARYKLI